MHSLYDQRCCRISQTFFFFKISLIGRTLICLTPEKGNLYLYSKWQPKKTSIHIVFDDNKTGSIRQNHSKLKSNFYLSLSLSLLSCKNTRCKIWDTKAFIATNGNFLSRLNNWLFSTNYSKKATVILKITDSFLFVVS